MFVIRAAGLRGLVTLAALAALAGCATPASPGTPAAFTSSELARATAGYRKVERDGRRVWCREERATGVLMPRMRCVTEAQLLEQERAAGRLRDRLSRPEACALEGCSKREQ